MRRRFIVQFAVMTGNSELFDQTQDGEQFRLVKNDFNENLFVKQIQTPRPEPDQVDEENRQRITSAAKIQNTRAAS